MSTSTIEFKGQKRAPGILKRVKITPSILLDKTTEIKKPFLPTNKGNKIFYDTLLLSMVNDNFVPTKEDFVMYYSIVNCGNSIQDGLDMLFNVIINCQKIEHVPSGLSDFNEFPIYYDYYEDFKEFVRLYIVAGAKVNKDLIFRQLLVGNSRYNEKDANLEEMDSVAKGVAVLVDILYELLQIDQEYLDDVARDVICNKKSLKPFEWYINGIYWEWNCYEASPKAYLGSVKYYSKAIRSFALTLDTKVWEPCVMEIVYCVFINGSINRSLSENAPHNIDDFIKEYSTKMAEKYEICRGCIDMLYDDNDIDNSIVYETFGELPLFADAKYHPDMITIVMKYIKALNDER